MKTTLTYLRCFSGGGRLRSGRRLHGGRRLRGGSWLRGNSRITALGSLLCVLRWGLICDSPSWRNRGRKALPGRSRRLLCHNSCPIRLFLLGDGILLLGDGILLLILRLLGFSLRQVTFLGLNLIGAAAEGLSAHCSGGCDQRNEKDFPPENHF